MVKQSTSLCNTILHLKYGTTVSPNSSYNSFQTISKKPTWLPSFFSNASHTNDPLSPLLSKVSKFCSSVFFLTHWSTYCRKLGQFYHYMNCVAMYLSPPLSSKVKLFISSKQNQQITDNRYVYIYQSVNWSRKALLLYALLNICYS